MTNAPVDVVTLVFTDVQGSTQLWEAQTTAMSEALELHHRILRAAMSACGGYEVKSEGDAFMVAFGDTLAAASFCLRAQEQLLQAPWPLALLQEPDAAEEKDESGKLIWRGLRVRMGIHRGTPERRDSAVTGRTDYVGPVVNRAARVAGAAHGGQIVCSEDAWQFIAPRLASVQNPETRDLGEHTLKGVKAPLRLFEISPRALAARHAQATRHTLAWDPMVDDDHFITMLGKDERALDADGKLHGQPLARAAAPRSAVRAAETPLELDLDRMAKPKAEPEEEPVDTGPSLAAKIAKLAAMVAFLVLVLGAGGYYLGLDKIIRGEPPPKPAERQAPLLQVTSEPDGAQVTIAGTNYGETPMAIPNDFAPGPVTISVTKRGYAAETKTTQGGQAARVEFVLRKR